MTPLDRYLTEVEQRYELDDGGRYRHSALFINNHAGPDIERLTRIVRVMGEALEKIEIWGRSFAPDHDFKESMRRESCQTLKRVNQIAEGK